MRTLQEDIDDLDRMVEAGAPKDGIRSQIRLISREVAALEADYARLAEEHRKLQEAHETLRTEYAAYKKGETDATSDEFQKEADERQRIIQSKLLNHNF